jgi:hypothetical protein
MPHKSGCTRIQVLPGSSVNLAPVIALVRLRSLIPTHMNDEIWAYLGLSAESMCGHSTITVPNPTPFPLQGPPVLEDEWTNAWTMDIPAPIHYPQVSVKARYLIELTAA